MLFSKKKKNTYFTILFICAMISLFMGKTHAGQDEKSIFPNSGTVSIDPKNHELQGDNLSSSLHKMTLALFIVVLLGAAVIYVSKRVLPKLSHVQGRNIKVVETVHLGSRKTIHLLEVYGQKILIGSTPDRVTKLAEIFSEKEFPLNLTPEKGKDGAAV